MVKLMMTRQDTEKLITKLVDRVEELEKRVKNLEKRMT
jgi:chaperonin cofactor prefoldin